MDLDDQLADKQFRLMKLHSMPLNSFTPGKVQDILKHKSCWPVGGKLQADGTNEQDLKFSCSRKEYTIQARDEIIISRTEKNQGTK